MSETATEVLARQNEFWLKHGAKLARISEQMTDMLLGPILNTKVPLIKYGRQRRRYRRLFPRIDHLHVTINSDL